MGPLWPWCHGVGDHRWLLGHAELHLCGELLATQAPVANLCGPEMGSL